MNKRGGKRSKVVSRLFCLFVALLPGACLSGCGYHLARPGGNLPPHVSKIAVPVLKNETMEAGLEADLTDRLRRRLAAGGWAELTAVEDSDAVLIGTITKFKTSPISFSDVDYAVEYRAQLHVSIRLVDREGVVLWEDRNLVKVREYRAVTGIFESEANKRTAIEWLAEEIAAEVHDRIYDGFD